MKIAVIGTGYVGLVSGTCFAAWGNEVVCVDKNTQKINALELGVVPIYEPGLDELVERNVAAGRLSFTCNLANAVKGAAVVFIAVGTPPRAGHGDADLSFVYMAARELAPLIDDNAVVVVKSTVPVGTGDVVEKIIGSVRKAGTFSVASNPEFLREGVAIRDFMEPDRVVIGVEDEHARKVVTELYNAPLEVQMTPIVVTQRRTSELIKYAANAFLATKITFINELADLCEQVESNVSELALGMGLDKRIGTSFLNAGPGYGGSCFPKDTMALLRTAQDYGVAVRIVQETVTANEARKRRMALKVMDALGGEVDGLTIAVLGLTFKPDTDDMRDAPSVPLIETLQRFGARIRAYDPVGIENAQQILSDVELIEDPYECARGADAVVVITEWGDIRSLDLSRLKTIVRQPVLVDLRNAYEPGAAEKAGFRVSAIGRSTSARHDARSSELLPHPADVVTSSRGASGVHCDVMGGSVDNG
ncbi:MULTISPECIES: UDP-glucose dehydrogenase family protein [Rhizobium]|uniref:UDP-glucose 6-dehydrogenase n=1 Tax=Rhizobium favelukesii TaxID=348824 RepID=W6RSE2_9HYPH|nr:MULTISPECIES: UDP-glucose/GDP-mannose dehydrogenase family protein [Rhizobium]MCS0462092.1 UDP-glucose/GDP-mannose dehydrogenase family protein [Rhizobium favelukesii]UFS80003.1 UDP-glucose/GDP-mannose dehydrogenase family protein [Rhizobium sp. T136]CDM61733.1 UDP-glucose 6-dehydrogenase [Rhizobium favelukesii]